MGKLAGIFDPSLDHLVRAPATDLPFFGKGAHLHKQPGLAMIYEPDCFEDFPQSDPQPFRSASGNIITWDGRLDSRADLLDLLDPGDGARRPDAAVALAQYEAQDVDGFRRLIGDWSAAFWNESARSLTLASDFAGTRPLYYCETGGRVRWSSSLGHLARWTSAHEPDDDYITEMLVRGASNCRTPYRGIYSVPPGTAARFSSKGLALIRFWQLDPYKQVRFRDEREYEEQFRALFKDAVRVRLRTRGPVHAELSGGLDSSSIVCEAQRLIAAGDVPAPRIVGVTYSHPGSPDEKFANAVRERCGIEKMAVEVRSYPFLTERSVGDSAPSWWSPRHVEVARRLKAAGSSVLLTGQVGDLTMGNWRDDSEQVAELVQARAWTSAIGSAFAWSRYLQVPVYSVLIRAIRLNLPWLSARLENTEYSNGEAGDSLSRRLRKYARMLSAEDQDEHIWKKAPVGRRKHFRALAAVLRNRTLQVPEALHPLSYTHPYVHRPLVEFMTAIPAEIVCRVDEPRRLMRRALAGLLPDMVLHRRSKASFNTVFAAALRPLAAKLLEAPSTCVLAARGYIDPSNLEARLRRFLSGLECNEPQLRHIILIEFWLRSRLAGHFERTHGDAVTSLS